MGHKGIVDVEVETFPKTDRRLLRNSVHVLQDFKALSVVPGKEKQSEFHWRPAAGSRNQDPGHYKVVI